MRTKATIFISEPIHPAGIQSLGDNVLVVQAPDTLKETTLRLIGNTDAVILRATTQFDKEVIAAARNLKVIARTGVGINNVDIEAAGERGIIVCNTPGVNAGAVAEHTIALVLAMAKQVFAMDKAVRTGDWEARFSPQQMEVEGKVAGLIGLGEIGSATAAKCLAMGMNVIAYDPFAKNTESRIGLTKNITDIFSQSDFVLLHCPATPQTANMVNREQFAMMKPSAYLINTSRGELVNEEALIDALQNGTIAGAALDVFLHEPLSADHPFQHLQNLILSPHVAGSTIEANERMAVQAAQAVIDVLAGKEPANICNRKFLKAMATT